MYCLGAYGITDKIRNTARSSYSEGLQTDDNFDMCHIDPKAVVS